MKVICCSNELLDSQLYKCYELYSVHKSFQGFGLRHEISINDLLNQPFLNYSRGWQLGVSILSGRNAFHPYIKSKSRLGLDGLDVFQTTTSTIREPAADACFSSPLPLVFIDQTDARYDDMIGLHSILLLLQRGLRQLQTLPHTAGKKHHLPGLRQQSPIFSVDSAKLAGFAKEYDLWRQT